MKSKTLNSENTVFYRKLLSFVLPIAFQQFMLAAVSASDALMLGFVNQDSLSAVISGRSDNICIQSFYGWLDNGNKYFSSTILW